MPGCAEVQARVACFGWGYAGEMSVSLVEWRI